MSFEDRGPTNPRPVMDTRPVIDSEGTGYMSQPVFESLKGITDTNPYGNEGFFTRVFGIDPSKIDYTNTLGAQGIANVRNLAYDQFMNPLDSRGQVRGMLDEGSLTRFGPVTRDPNRRPDRGIASMLPIVGPMLNFIDSGSELSVPGAQFPTEAGPSYVPATSAGVNQAASPTAGVRVNQTPSGSIFIKRVDEPAFPEVVNPNLYDESELAIAEENRRKADAAQAVLDSLLSKSEVPITAAEVTGDYIPLTPDNPFFFLNQPTGNTVDEDMNRRFQNEARFADLVNPDRDRMLALEPVVEGRPISYGIAGDARPAFQTQLYPSGVPSISDMIRFPTGTQL